MSHPTGSSPSQFDPTRKAFLRKLQEALGLGDRAVRRIVLDFSVDDVVKAYVEEYVAADRLGGLLDDIPRLEPAIRWCDRVRVDNQTTQVVVRELKREDSVERQHARQLLDVLKDGTPDVKDTLLNALYPGSNTVRGKGTPPPGVK